MVPETRVFQAALSYTESTSITVAFCPGFSTTLYAVDWLVSSFASTFCTFVFYLVYFGIDALYKSAFKLFILLD